MHSEPPDRELDAGEQQRIAELTADQLRAIDDALLDLAQMRTVSGEFRISITRSEFALVEDGKLEAQGFLDRMRYSEVRLPADPGLQRR